MPGLAKTNEFMLGTATVMLGPVEDLYDLNPEDHSIGLVKNFTATSEPGYTELTQGVKNTIVASVLTSNPVRCTMEVYEYTAKNLAYALGIQGAADYTSNTVSTTVATPVVPGSPGVTSLSVVDSAGFTQGDYIMILNDAEDDFVVRRIETVSVGTLVVDTPLPAIAEDAVVNKVSEIPVGSKDNQPYFSAKIAGRLEVDGSEMVIYIPKLRIVSGFNLAFTTDDYANLPLEFTVYDLVPTDPFYSKFNGAQAQIFKR